MSGDAAQQGDVIVTWKSFAVLAIGFWIGSSSAGKAKVDRDNLAITSTSNESKIART